MGCADVIPGVSGGTVAFIANIYEELIHSIKSIDLVSLRLLSKYKFAEFWGHINGNFLFAVFLGIATSLLSLSKLMTYLLKQYPISIWSFFFGLILMSSPIILKDIKKRNVTTWISLLLGAVIAYLITVATPRETPDNLWFIFFCGSLAICAMILPGISGAFILLLIGKYEFMINSLIEMRLDVIIVFILGAFIGLVLFSHFLSWILIHFRNSTLGALAGFMIGSLNKVWPWKEVISYRLTDSGIQIPALDKNILPGRYMEIYHQDPNILYAVLFLSLGIFAVILIEKIAQYKKIKSR